MNNLGTNACDTRRNILPVCLLVILAMTTPVGAQTYLQDAGAPTFTTAMPVENGFINLANGNLHLEFSVGTFAQRGPLPGKHMLAYDGAIWSNNGSVWSPNNTPVPAPGYYATYPALAGWRFIFSYMGGISNASQVTSTTCPQDGKTESIQYSNFVWNSPDGASHSFPIQTSVGYLTACGMGQDNENGGAFASDASGYYMDVGYGDYALVFSPDGSDVANKDTNGNMLGSYVDTVGRAMPSVTSPDNGVTWNVSVPNSQGTTTYTVKTAFINVLTNFGISGVTEFSGQVGIVTEVDLPDSTKYSFKYDCDSSGNPACGSPAGQGAYYGVLTSMTLPTGGQINYSYVIFTDAYGNKYPWVSSRTTTPGGMWTFTPQLVGTPCTSTQVDCEQQITVGTPSGDNEVYTFALNGGAWNGMVQYYNGAVSSANLIATTNECFNFVSINSNGQCSYSTTTGSPATAVTKSALTTTWPGTNISSTTEYQFDPNYSNLLTKSEWNFYTGTLPTTADRTTTFAYLNTSNYINANILNRPTSIVVKDKNGNRVAETDYSYDQYALTSVTGVVSHDDANYGTGNNVRGNATQISKWLNTTGGLLTTTNHYDTLGNVTQTTDPNGNTSSFTYTDNYYNYSPSTPTNAYITQITKPATSGVSHIIRTQYYFGSGLAAATCGENFTSACSYGLAAPRPDYASMSYDSMNRPIATNAGDGGQTTITYGTSTPINITTTTKIDGTHSLVSTTVLDGLGRTSQTQTSSPQGTIYVDTTYDSNGRIHTVKNPHYTASSPTDGITTYSYDGLDRVTVITEPSGGTKTRSYTPDANAIMVQQQDEIQNSANSWVDAFGRTLQVNLFPGSGTVRTQYTYDILNNLTKVDESGTNWSNDRVRTFTYDSLSRLINASNPEANAIAYTYDSNGNILTKVNGRGTTITYQYDALNRLASRAYNDGMTSTANFVYDACPSGGCPTGVSPQYPVGRLIKTYTSSAQMFYSYDVLGRNAEQWQCTPINCSTGFIAFTYTHNYQGAQTSISYNGNFTISQAYDSAGRITQLTNSNSNQFNPAMILSMSQFSPVGPPTQISFGNGLAETETYNNRLQPTQLRVYLPPSSDVLNQTLTWGRSKLWQPRQRRTMGLGR
jgi:YD repeat-containing protein